MCIIAILAKFLFLFIFMKKKQANKKQEQNSQNINILKFRLGYRQKWHNNAENELTRQNVCSRISVDWFPSLIKLHFRYAYNVW